MTHLTNCSVLNIYTVVRRNFAVSFFKNIHVYIILNAFGHLESHKLLFCLKIEIAPKKPYFVFNNYCYRIKLVAGPLKALPTFVSEIWAQTGPKGLKHVPPSLLAIVKDSYYNCQERRVGYEQPIYKA